MGIGERIKQRRKELDLSVDDIAEKLGKNRATIYRYESDDIENLSITILEPLAKILETTPADLMGWEKSSTINALTDKIKKLPTDKQQEAEKIIDRISAGETIAAHRADNPMDELPEEARKSIEDFKKFIFEKHGIKYD